MTCHYNPQPTEEEKQTRKYLLNDGEICEAFVAFEQSLTEKQSLFNVFISINEPNAWLAGSAAFFEFLGVL